MCSAADDPSQHDAPVITSPRRYVLSGSAPGPVRMSPVTRPYWQAIPEAERDAIEAAVPDGCVLYLKPGFRARRGTTDVSLRREVRDYGAPTYEGVRDARGYLTARLIWSVLRGEVVTTDAEGFVTSIEEAV